MMTALSFNRWRAPAATEETRARATACQDRGVPRAVAELLAQRGHGSVDAATAAFMATALQDPTRLPDMDRAVARIAQAVRARERVIVYGDYDADGMCATAILTLALQRAGVPVTPVIPHKLKEAYDLSVPAVHRAAEMGVTLIVAVDCGTSAHDAIAEATRRKIDVVVIDHHVGTGTLPRGAAAVVNLCRPGLPAPATEQCAGMLVFKTVWALTRTLGWPNEALREYGELAALATIADHMPLTGENRALLRRVLPQLAQPANRGLQALLETSGARRDGRGTGGAGAAARRARAGQPSNATPARQLRAADLAMRVVPLLNALGRMGSAQRGVQLLVADDIRIARGLASIAGLENEGRRREEAAAFEAACAQLDEAPEDAVIVVAADTWHPGIVGNVASRLVEKFGRPAIVVAFDGDRGKGSGRSVGGVDLRGVVTEAVRQLVAERPFAAAEIRFGGHPGAIGLELHRRHLETLRAAIQGVGETVAPIEGPAVTFQVDAMIQLEEIDETLVEWLDRMEPFGRENPAPLFQVSGVRLMEVTRVGRGDQPHLCGLLVSGTGSAQVTLEFMGFHLAEENPPEWVTNRAATVIGHLDVSPDGRRIFRLRDLRLAAD